MRLGLVIGVLALAALPVAGQAEDKKGMDCAAQAALVMEGINARVDGASKRTTRKMLVEALDREAGAMLADFIYMLPEDQLTEAVGDAFKAQCEAL